MITKSYRNKLSIYNASYNRKVPTATIRRGNSRTGIWQIAGLQQLKGTEGKNSDKTAKLTQKNQNGNLLGREITPTKHGTLCLPEILEQEPVITSKF